MTTATQSSTALASATKPGTPVIVDLGKKSRKQIRDMRRGTGKLIDKVQGVIEELRAAGTVSADSQPVVFVVRQKRKRAARMFPFA